MFQRILPLILAACFVLSPAHGNAGQKLTFSAVQGSATNAASYLILKRAYGQLGISVAVKAMPAARALEDAATGVTDGELHRIFAVGEKHPSLMRIQPPLFTINEMFISKKAITWKTLDDLKSYRIGIRRGIMSTKAMLEKRKFHVTVANDSKKMFELLDKDRVDLIVLADHNDWNKGLGAYANKFIVLEKPLVTLKLYHYLHKKHAALKTRLEEVLRKMKASGEMDRITRKALGK